MRSSNRQPAGIGWIRTKSVRAHLGCRYSYTPLPELIQPAVQADCVSQPIRIKRKELCRTPVDHARRSCSPHQRSGTASPVSASMLEKYMQHGHSSLGSCADAAKSIMEASMSRLGSQHAKRLPEVQAMGAQSAGTSAGAAAAVASLSELLFAAYQSASRSTHDAPDSGGTHTGLLGKVCYRCNPFTRLPLVLAPGTPGLLQLVAKYLALILKVALLPLCLHTYDVQHTLSVSDCHHPDVL